MIIDVNKLKQQGKEEEEFFFEFYPDRPLLDLPAADISGGVKVSGKIRISGRKAKAEGRACYTIRGECSRCLSLAEKTVAEEFDCEFSSEAGAEFPIKAGLIDLTVPVEETVITSAPMVIYCRDDRKGVCPRCGKNLNEGECNCKN